MKKICQLLVVFSLCNWPAQTKSSQGLLRASLTENKTPITANCKIRKEFTFMSLTERMRFVNAYKTISTVEPFKTRYGALIMDHPKMVGHVHNKEQFLPWHRLFLLKFEKLLGDVDPRVMLPYWDWSLSHKSPWRSSPLDIWTALPWGLGGDGDQATQCVTSGPFASDKWGIAVADGKESCLKRKFNGVPPGIITIHRALRYAPENFTQFEEYIRNFIHDALHWRVGGTMSDEYASRAPEFIMHHAFLDKIWRDYQKQSPAHKWAFFNEANYTIYNTNIPVRKMVDNEELLGTGVCYKDPYESYGDIHKKLKQLDLNKIRSLMTKEAFSKPYFQRFLKY